MATACQATQAHSVFNKITTITHVSFRHVFSSLPIAMIAAVVLLGSVAEGVPIYKANNGTDLSSTASWWADSNGTVASTSAPTSSTGSGGGSPLTLVYNNIVSSANSARSGGGTGGSFAVAGIRVENAGGAITLTTANNATQTITIGADGIDLSTATQDLTLRAGSLTNPTYPAYFRVGPGSNSPITEYWKIKSGRTLTIGSPTLNTNNVYNTNINSQTGGTYTLNIRGDGVSAMGTLDLYANVGGTMIVNIDGVGTSNSGGNVNFYGFTNTFSSSGLAVSNATATFRNAAGTSSGPIVLNSGGSLAGVGTVGSMRLNPGGLIAPGLSLGTLNSTSSLDWYGASSSSAQMAFELSSIDNTSDKISGVTSFNKGSGSIFQFDFLGSGASGYTYTLIQSGSRGDIGNGTFQASDFSYTNLASGLSGSFVFDNNNLLLVVVPEPLSTVGGVIGLAVLGLMARRLKKKGC